VTAFTPSCDCGHKLNERRNLQHPSHDPEGKLPVSFDRNWQDDPSHAFYYPIKRADRWLQVTENNHPSIDYDILHVKYDDHRSR